MNYLEKLQRVEADVVRPLAPRTDAEARFPREAVHALGQAGLLGLISSPEVGGLGLGLSEATQVVASLASICPSTAMIVGMHFSATIVIEQHQGPRDVRAAIAQGQHLSTLAFSEAGSRSHFWAPQSTARAEGDRAVLDASKSWVTSAFEADSYVWSSQPVADGGASTIWLVDARSAGLSQPGAFNGLGMRGNASTPVTASNVRIPLANRLGEDGKGFDVMMGTVLPWFCCLTSACSVGLMNGVLQAASDHVVRTQHQHLGQSLADLPTIRAYLARARVRADQAAALLADTLAAIDAGRPDTMLRVLEVKASAAEAALEVTDTAMRVCGGAAFRKEAGIERLFRDSRAASVMAPTSDVLYDFIGKAVLGMPLF